jgi:hypothetical protein
MMKCMILAASLVVALVLTSALATPAHAQSRLWQMRAGGYCPAGTCSKNGGHRARHVANCNASYCMH